MKFSLKKSLSLMALGTTLVFGLPSLTSCQQEKPEDVLAKAKIQPLGDSKVSGEVTFYQLDEKTKITIDLKNFEDIGFHGFHIHQVGDCSDSGKAAGGHFQPVGYEHGSRREKTSHAGDLGNIKTNGKGLVNETFTTDKISLDKKEKDYIVGRAVVVHAKADDLITQPSGSAGQRIACGVIKLASSSP